MKLRSGFVSNSSSSLFLIIFPRMPTSVEDVIEMLFGKDAKGSDEIECIYHEDIKYSLFTIAEAVYHDILRFVDLATEEKDFKRYCHEIYPDLLELKELDREFPDLPDDDQSKEALDKYYEDERKFSEKQKMRERALVGVTNEDLQKKKLYKDDKAAKGMTKQQIDRHNECIERDIEDRWKRVDKRNDEYLEVWIKKNPGVVVFLNYGDEGGTLEAHLEHAGVFKRLPHFRFSHH